MNIRRTIRLTESEIERVGDKMLHAEHEASCIYVWRLGEEEGKLVAREGLGSYQEEARQVAHRLKKAQHEMENVIRLRSHYERQLEPIKAYFRGDKRQLAYLTGMYIGGRLRDVPLRDVESITSTIFKRKQQELESNILDLARKQQQLESEVPGLGLRLREILSCMKREDWYRISLGVVKGKYGDVVLVGCCVYMRPSVFEKAQVFQREEPLYLGTTSLSKEEQRRNFWWHRDKFWVSTMYSEEEARLLLWEKGRREEKKLERLVKAKAAAKEVREEAGRERIPEEVRLLVWDRDGGRCVKCGSAEDLEYDHIIPVSKGGSSTEKNVQLLCAKCNQEKGDRIA